MSKTNIIFIIAVLLLSQINIVYAENFEWTQTTQADFDAGKKVNLNTWSSPGDVLLGFDVDKLTIAAGDYHTVGLKEDGTVVAVGRNDYDKLNVSNWSNIKAIAAGEYSTVGLKEDGTVAAVGWDAYDWNCPDHCKDGGPLNVSGWSNITAIEAGWAHTVGLKEDGTVVAVGWNWSGQANVDDWSNIRQTSYANKYSAFGTLTSSVFDIQNASYFGTISWNATIPDEAGTGAVKFQIATGNDKKLTNKFFGPDGTANTYYTTSGHNIWQGHNGDRYLRYKLYLTTANPDFTPTLHDVTINYRSGSV
ncbi:MAG: hypothetical protein WA102_14345 [Candidatus Methanoperedens sp.]